MVKCLQIIFGLCGLLNKRPLASVEVQATGHAKRLQINLADDLAISEAILTRQWLSICQIIGTRQTGTRADFTRRYARFSRFIQAILPMLSSDTGRMVRVTRKHGTMCDPNADDDRDTGVYIMRLDRPMAHPAQWTTEKVGFDST